MILSRNVKGRSRSFENVLRVCRDILINDPIASEARDYLDSRLSREAQERHGFGFFPPDEHLGILTTAVNPRELESKLLMYPRFIAGGKMNHGHFHYHNLVMPFKNAYGNVVSIVGRTLLPTDDQKEFGIPKYKYSFGSNKQLYLYGMDQAKNAIIENDFVICVEGQMDCIACHEAGIKNVVACGGANLLPIQFYQLRRYTNNLVLLLDNDEAGKSARDKIKRRYAQHAYVSSIKLPGEFKDIDELLRSGTEDQINYAIGVVKVLHNKIKERNGG